MGKFDNLFLLDERTVNHANSITADLQEILSKKFPDKLFPELSFADNDLTRESLKLPRSNSGEFPINYEGQAKVFGSLAVGSDIDKVTIHPSLIIEKARTLFANDNSSWDGSERRRIVYAALILSLETYYAISLEDKPTATEYQECVNMIDTFYVT